ncbi:Oidioi.mRNA.OKI2018_I69.YSR.g17104.t1.cds [Oikopleura dioica]|uniref:Oidioi.mRNA.OKI2018_I69.YSR.g17104.t1.cds n=1 Tax=Oikopleura dioica TaxID=34765 RepID=A0ABN7SLZ5_OIKDI|nr:Oidioi.mRNA.OKI2018_I69.YSR.g17104.t1.cds [Oikopleura dioica]
MELATHIRSWITYVSPAKALNKDILWSLPSNNDGKVFTTEELSGQAELAKVLFDTQTDSSPKIWNLKVEQFIAHQNDESDSVRSLIANSISPLFTIKRSGTRIVAPQIASEFLSKDQAEEVLEEWLSFQESDQPAGKVNMNILSLVSSRELNEVAQLIKEKYVNAKTPAAIYRELAALLWRKLGVGFADFEDINGFAAALASRTTDPIDHHKGAEKIKVELSLFVEEFKLKEGFESFWVQLIHVVRIGTEWAHQWASTFNQGSTPPGIFACLNLLDWFNPPYSPSDNYSRVPAHAQQMLKDVGDFAFWVIYGNEPIKFLILPEKIMNPNQVKYLMRIGRLIARAIFDAEELTSAVANLEETIRANSRENLAPVVKSWDKFVKELKKQAREIESTEKTALSVHILPQAFKTQRKKIIGWNLYKFIVRSSRVSTMEMLDRYFTWFDSEVVAPEDPNCEKYKWFLEIAPRRRLEKNEQLSGPLFDREKAYSDNDNCAFVGCVAASVGFSLPDGETAVPACDFHILITSEVAFRERNRLLTTIVPTIDGLKVEIAAQEPSLPESKIIIITNKVKDNVLHYYEKHVAGKTTAFLHPQLAQDSCFPSFPQDGSLAWPSIFYTAISDDKSSARGRGSELDKDERAADFASFLIEWKAREGLHLVELDNGDLSYAAAPKFEWAPTKEEFFVLTTLTTSPEKRLAQYAMRIRSRERDFIWFIDAESSISRNLRRDPRLTAELATTWFEKWIREFPSRTTNPRFRVDLEYWLEIFCNRSYASDPDNRHQLQQTRSDHPNPPALNPYFQVRGESLLHGRERIAEYDLLPVPTPTPSIASSETSDASKVSAASSTTSSPPRTPGTVVTRVTTPAPPTWFLEAEQTLDNNEDRIDLEREIQDRKKRTDERRRVKKPENVPVPEPQKRGNDEGQDSPGTKAHKGEPKKPDSWWRRADTKFPTTRSTDSDSSDGGRPQFPKTMRIVFNSGNTNNPQEAPRGIANRHSRRYAEILRNLSLRQLDKDLLKVVDTYASHEIWEELESVNLGNRPALVLKDQKGRPWMAKRMTTREVYFDEEAEEVLEFEALSSEEETEGQDRPARSAFAGGLPRVERRQDEKIRKVTSNTRAPQNRDFRLNERGQGLPIVRKPKSKKLSKKKGKREALKKLRKNMVTENDLIDRSQINTQALSVAQRAAIKKAASIISAKTFMPNKADEQGEILFKILLDMPAETSQFLADIERQFGDINGAAVRNQIFKESRRREEQGLPIILHCFARDFFPSFDSDEDE